MPRKQITYGDDSYRLILRGVVPWEITDYLLLIEG